MTARELADERIARLQLYGRRSGTVDVMAGRLVESNHAHTECENGHSVFTVQRDGKGPAFFPAFCPACGGTLPDVYPPHATSECACGDPSDCKEQCGHA